MEYDEFNKLLKKHFDQYKDKIMDDYFPKILKLGATKLLEVNAITKDQHQMLLENPKSFFEDESFTNEHHHLLYKMLVADILHADDGNNDVSSKVFPKVYGYQYKTYLGTKVWKDIVTTRKEQNNYTCENCGIKVKNYVMPMLEGHHKNYNNVYNELLEDIAILCRDCHQQHYKG